MDSSPDRKDNKYLAATALAALGVVFGDIGTSPLYALKECFAAHHGHLTGLDPTRGNVLCILSMVIWTRPIIVSIKYVMFVMRADPKGEGGIMARVSLALTSKENRSKHTLVSASETSAMMPPSPLWSARMTN